MHGKVYAVVGFHGKVLRKILAMSSKGSVGVNRGVEDGPIWGDTWSEGIETSFKWLVFFSRLPLASLVPGDLNVGGIRRFRGSKHSQL